MSGRIRRWWCYKNFFGCGWLLDRVVSGEDYREACSELATMCRYHGDNIDDCKVGDELIVPGNEWLT